ncbi:MAG TPA: NAD(P)-dependent oxidoreductase [Beijerinckiaceae bacterium]|jgi:3-hydroxyisobutyrate dehydrogenase-like beta-hydroxyacid dehydrogenase|nr:NAD(P)-dependent oxidoreductase [Beijerinckiaceae bacterium]
MKADKIGFIGVGVMGEPMCRNLAAKSGRPVIAFDRDPAPLERLKAVGVEPAGSIPALARTCDIIFLALASGKHVETVCTDEEGLVVRARAGQIIVDLGTSPVDLTRSLAAKFREREARYADAPIARTRQAAEEGTLSIMVGADAETFAEIQPLLACCATDITHCGPVGSGQIVKILNNMVLAETVVALSEALVVARRAGLNGAILFETLMKGSADSFALRNHGMKAVLPNIFPERAFSTDYMRKDIGYALELATSVGAKLHGAELASRLLQDASKAGFADFYWPVVSRIVGA